MALIDDLAILMNYGRTTPMQIDQRDREAAWPRRPDCYKESDRQAWMAGAYDDIALIQAFARHRTADTARIAELEGALETMTKHYLELADSGDAGNWDARQEPQVQKAMAALGVTNPRTYHLAGFATTALGGQP